ncbi:MAG: hypothetical protein WCR55_07880 [Lentisphaerota bacterium]
MNRNQTKKYLALALFLLCFCASANYFYMDKTYTDILVANNIYANWTMSEPQKAPAELIKFAVTSGKIKSDDTPGKSRTEVLFPSQVIVFSQDGNFSYMWMKGPSQIGNITGKWKVENSTLIFTLIDDKHLSAYAKNSELRYEIIKITNVAATSLKFKGESYPIVTNIMPSSDNPIKDFKSIASHIEESVIGK